MSVLPWKIRTELITISDEHGNEIEGVPKYGSLTLDEIDMLTAWQNDPATEEMAFVDQAKKLVCAFFRYRLKLADSITDKEILTGPDGGEIPVSLLVAVFNFFTLTEAGQLKPADGAAEEKKLSTGLESSGDSSSTIQTAISSAPTISEESPSTSSDKPSTPLKTSDSEPLSLVAVR